MRNNTEKIVVISAVIFISIGVFFNQGTVSKLFNFGEPIEFSNKVVIWIFELFLIFWGLLLIVLIWQKRINLAINLLLLFSTIVLCLVVAEFFLRGLDRKYKPVVLSEEFHHDLRPDYSYIKYPSKYDEFEPVEIRINSLGIRGPEIPEKKENEYRIILLGDSFIEADEIKYQETVGELLNEKLNRENLLAGGQDYRVIQQGVGSWSPLLELNWLIKKGLNLKPDLVIIFLCINDFYPSYSNSDNAYAKIAVFDSDGLPLSFNLSQKITLQPRLLRLIKQPLSYFTEKTANFSQEEIDYLLGIDKPGLDSSLNSLVGENIKYSGLIRDIIRLSRPVELWDENVSEAVALSLGYLDKVKEILDNNDISLALTLVPLPWNISQDENIEGRKHYSFSEVIIPMGGIEDKIKSYCIENNIDYIDIYSEFKNFKEKNKEKLFLISDGHWNSQGHEVVAEIIDKYIYILDSK